MGPKSTTLVVVFVLLMVIAMFFAMYLTILGLKTVLFDSWILGVITFFVLFLEVTTTGDKKYTLLPKPIRTGAFVGFLIYGSFMWFLA